MVTGRIVSCCCECGRFDDGWRIEGKSRPRARPSRRIANLSGEIMGLTKIFLGHINTPDTDVDKRLDKGINGRLIVELENNLYPSVC